MACPGLSAAQWSVTPDPSLQTATPLGACCEIGGVVNVCLHSVLTEPEVGSSFTFSGSMNSRNNFSISGKFSFLQIMWRRHDCQAQTSAGAAAGHLTVGQQPKLWYLYMTIMWPWMVIAVYFPAPKICKCNIIKFEGVGEFSASGQTILCILELLHRRTTSLPYLSHVDHHLNQFFIF